MSRLSNLLLLLLLVWLTAAAGQERLDWQLVSEVSVKGLDQLALDNRGQIYYADRSGGIYHLNGMGNIVNHFSWERRGRVSQLDADRTVNIFLFSEVMQEYVILDRFLNPIANNRIDRLNVGFAQSATLGNNNVIWVFDESNLELLKIDFRRQQTLQQQPLALVLGKEDIKVREIREYRNSLYLRTDQSVYIFDNQGNFIKSLPYGTNAKLAFFQDDLYWIENKALVRLNQQTGEKSTYDIPAGTHGSQVQIQGKSAVFYSADKVQIYINPF